MYDPQTGRFSSKDPIGFNGGYTNLYVYVLNNPVNFTDPNGTNPLLIPLATGVIGRNVGGFSGYELSNSTTWQGKASNTLTGATIGVIGGTLAGLGSINAILGISTGLIPSGAQVLGGIAVDAGINAWGLGNLINGGDNNPQNSCAGGK